MWNTTPPRQVTAADVVRGVKRSCNPTYPFGGQPDISDILAGLQDVLQRLRQGVGRPAPPAQKRATSTATSISGVDGRPVATR